MTAAAPYVFDRPQTLYLKRDAEVITEARSGGGANGELFVQMQAALRTEAPTAATFAAEMAGQAAACFTTAEQARSSGHKFALV